MFFPFLRRDRCKRPIGRRPWFRPRLESLEDRSLLSTFAVLNLNDSGAGSLRQTILDANSAPGADTIVFAKGVTGRIALTSGELAVTDNLTINGPGASAITISGNDASRVFEIVGANVAISGLTIANGLAAGATPLGGGILNSSGILTISQVCFSNNRALGDSQTASGGGAIANVNGATLTLTGTNFNGNQSSAPNRSDGGAILNDGGSLLMVSGSSFNANESAGLLLSQQSFFGGDGGAISNGGNSTAVIAQTSFSDNHADGLDGSPGKGGGTGVGGAIYNGVSLLSTGNGALGAALTVDLCTFSGNQVLGGAGGSPTGSSAAGIGGNASGGAILNDVGATANFIDSDFRGNSARGGRGGDSLSDAAGGLGGETSGGAISVFRSHVTVQRTMFADNQAVGGGGGSSTATGGSGFVGKGGAIFIFDESGTLPAGLPAVVDLVNVTMSGNEASGGAGGAGGAGQGGDGGRGRGGAVALDFGTLNVTGTTLDENRATGGAGGPGAIIGHGGDALGGAISNGKVGNSFGAPLNFVTLLNSVVEKNRAKGGSGSVGGDALGGAIANEYRATATITNTAIHDNQAIGGNGTTAGGDGQGGAIWDQRKSTVTLLGSTVTDNTAMGGPGASPGAGVGGGVYIVPDGIVCADVFTVIAENHASTSDDDAFGVLCLI
jgi:hypothetical protein